jgi:pyrroloquinoline quinone biosynthesis protein B
MRIKLLGTAAGGGVPQWNCNCPVCIEARRLGGRVRPRTQSSAAVSADGSTWFLLNASPDIRQQILDAPALGPGNSQSRGSGIAGVLLTNADIDHSLGLLLLREGGRLPVYATDAARETLTTGISVAPVLETFCGIEWIQPPLNPEPLPKADGSESGLVFQAIPLAGKSPRFADAARAKAGADCHVVGYRIHDRSTGGGLLYLPNLAEFEDHLTPLLADANAILFDGTFWSDNEMIERGVGTQTATAMGHLPISGEAGSLARLRPLKARHKIYVHINNTNPILFEDSPERAEVERAGCSVGSDGTEIVI